MTLEELRDRIKNEVVLYEGELADWQWRQKGLVAEANELGITDFTRLVNDISRQVNRDFGKILDLKKKIVTVALQRQNKLSEVDINQFVTEAERVQLSRAFVTEQWIPAILAALPAAVPVTESASPVVGSNVPNTGISETKPQNQLVPEPAPVIDKVEAVRKKIKSILDDYDKHIQAQSLKFLFKAVDYDEAELAEEIRLYLSEHYYASVNPPRGNTLKEKLISTDWRHLSWWEKEQPKPAQSTEYVKTQTGYTTTPAMGNNGQSNQTAAAPWPSAERPQPVLPPPVIAPDSSKKSSFSDAALIGLAILSALVLIWAVLKMTRGEDPEPEPVRKSTKKRTSQKLGTYQNPKASIAFPAKSKTRTSVNDEEIASPEAERNEVQNDDADKRVNDRSGTDEKTVAKKPSTRLFDRVDENVGEFGLRPAQKGKFWGYIDKKNKWIIEPQYELATPFNNGKASVELDGNQFFIDRYGNRIREDN